MDLMEAIMIYKENSNICPFSVLETKKYFLFPSQSSYVGIYNINFIAVDKLRKSYNLMHVSECVKNKQDDVVQTYSEDQIRTAWRTILENDFLETGKLSVKFKGANTYSLTANKTYMVLSIENNRYKVIDETGQEQFYPSKVFEIIEK